MREGEDEDPIGGIETCPELVVGGCDSLVVLLSPPPLVEVADCEVLGCCDSDELKLVPIGGITIPPEDVDDEVVLKELLEGD